MLHFLRLRFATLRARLIAAFVLVVLLSAVIIGTIVGVAEYQTENMEASSDLRAGVLLKEAWINSWLDNLRATLTVFMSLSKMQEYAEAVLAQGPQPANYTEAYQHLQADLQDVLLEQTQLFERVFLIDSQGRVVLSTDPAQEGQLLTESRYVLEGLRRDYVEPPFYSPSLGRVTMFVAHPVQDRRGNPIGVLAGQVKLDRLNQIMAAPPGLVSRPQTYLVGLDHGLLTSSSPDQGGNPSTRLTINTEGANRGLNTQSSGSLLYNNSEGMPVIGFYHWLPDLQATLLAEENQAEAFQFARIELEITATATVGIVLAAIAVALVLIRSITSPLAELATTAAQIDAGHLELVARTGRPDEIGQLAQAFNSMTARLRDSISRLQQHVAELEQTHRERERLLGQVEQERQRAEESAYYAQAAFDESQQRQKEISALLEAARAVLEQSSFKETAQAIYVACKNLVGAQAGSVSSQNQDGTRSEYLYLDPEVETWTVDLTAPVPIRGLRTMAYATGTVVWENDLAHSLWKQLMPSGHVNFQNVLFAPIRAQGQVMGLLGLGNKPGGFTEHDGQMAQSFAELAAVALLNRRTLELLANSEERFRSVAQMASEAIITADSQGKIAFWNRAAEDTFGYPATEAIGHELTLIMPERFIQAHRQALARTLSSGAPLVAGKSLELVARRQDGTEVPIELSLSMWKSREGVFFTSIVRDIAKRKWAQAVMDIYVRNLQFLSSSAMHFLEKMSYQQVLDYVAEKLDTLVEDALILVGEYDAGDNCMIVRACAGNPSDREALSNILGSPLAGLRFTPIPEAWKKLPDSRFVKIEGGLQGLSFDELPLDLSDRIEREMNLAAIFVMPLAVEEELLGAVGLLSHGPSLPPQTTVVEAFVRQAAIALKTRRAEEELREARAELERRVQARTQELALANEGLRAEMAERQRAEEKIAGLYLSEHNARQFAETLRAASWALTKSLDLDIVLDTLLDYLARLIPYGSARIMLLEGATQLSIRAARGYEDSTETVQVQGEVLHAETYPQIHQVLTTRESVLIADTRRDLNWSKLRGAERARSWLGTPLIAGGHVIGICALDKTEPGSFTEEHKRLAEALAAQAAVAVQNAWLFDQVRAGGERLQTLSRQLVEVQEGERRYIARELHDEAGQALTGLMVGLRVLEREADHPEVVIARAAELRRVTDGVLEELHRLAMHLRPATLDQLGLVAALHEYVEAIGEKHGLDIEFSAAGFDGARLLSTVETALYRIVQEALTNVVRHAHARRAEVLLERRPDRVSLTVEDDGVGLDPALALHSARLGLLGMRERVEMLGGQLTLESDAGLGTTLMVEIPYGDSDSNSG